MKISEIHAQLWKVYYFPGKCQEIGTMRHPLRARTYGRARVGIQSFHAWLGFMVESCEKERATELSETEQSVSG